MTAAASSLELDRYRGGVNQEHNDVPHDIPPTFAARSVSPRRPQNMRFSTC